MNGISQERSWFTWQCQEAHQLGCPKPHYQSWKHLCVTITTLCKVLATKTKFSILSYNIWLNREMWQAPCSHSDRLFSGFLRTCQHVILLTPFKNLSLVGTSFLAFWVFLHTPVDTKERPWQYKFLFLNFLVMICVNWPVFCALRDSISGLEDTQTSQIRLAVKLFKCIFLSNGTNGFIIILGLWRFSLAPFSSSSSPNQFFQKDLAYHDTVF